jgi:phosphoglycolate phosphatase-like HAD superfamily hydrolase
MIIFLDLDGTLTHTTHSYFKKMKDGIEKTDVELIKKYVFPKALDFIKKQLLRGNKLYIISDSHPNYVRAIAEQIFKLPYLSLADKPNDKKTREFIQSIPELKDAFLNKDNFILIGDSWLDIALGRLLNIRTVLTKFYNTTEVEARDGIGDDWKPMKEGPTYYANNFNEVSNIIENPIKNLLALEAVFQGESSSKAVKFKFNKHVNGFTAFRCLARQEDGECDRYARADKYYQIDNPLRTTDFLNNLALSVSNYLKKVESHIEFSWDYLSYVSDKKTTTPPNKMKQIFDLVESNISKVKLFEWDESVKGSLRNQPDYKSRREFIAKYLSTNNTYDLKGKSIIVIDDQFTSSATAYEIATQLRNRGAKNILFIALFYLILPLTNKMCPRCGKKMKIKINHKNGNKFYSCIPPKYRGEGCGNIINIYNEK